MKPSCVPFDPPPELSVYRDRTAALLRRYLRMSIAMGKMPTVLGRQFFRARVTSYRVQSFEDVVIFVHDVERCLAQLDGLSQQMIARVVLQEYSYDEAATLFGCSRRSIAREVPIALDKVTHILLRSGLLQPFGFQQATAPKTVSRGKKETFPACA
jgi:hypothetical protein